MTLAQIYSVACQAGLQHLEVCLSDEVYSGSKVSKVEVGFYDSLQDEAFSQEAIEDHILDQIEYGSDYETYGAYERDNVTKVLVIS
ncbi:MAG: hypothetical protein PHY47_01070 [Lachnospiraceae bacterium]|nr:hypothetical protein [Lachnospiraceae bacterium]